ncbi:transferase [Sulfurimicrobium lacus]|uniref:spermine/spermidine synthase domain-containing protein n=1 Tax=Sulfurimicrobium lacus TaxID=2715678 RepID=UPI001FCEB1F2|nr:transferase [Sulfurimicrobium lacus]
MSDFLFKYHAALPQTLAGKPFLYEGNEVITLHFDFATTQSHMCKCDPEKLILGYTRTMMGFLLFQPKPERIAMVGLGGGSLAKYCLRHLPNTHFTAVEINPEVIALRDNFRIPPDGPNFKVICANGAVYVQNHSELVDVLLVDGFDRDGQPRELCSVGFYDHCYAKLRDGGVLVVNLLSGDNKFRTYAARIRERFDDQVVVMEAEGFGNKIAFAYKGRGFPPLATTMSERVHDLGLTHTVPLHTIAKKVIHN